MDSVNGDNQQIYTKEEIKKMHERLVINGEGEEREVRSLPETIISKPQHQLGVASRNKGKKLSEEHKRKIRMALKGHGPWSGKKRPPFSKRWRENMSNVPWNKGIKIDRNKYPKMGHLTKHNEESKRKMRESLKGRRPWNKGKPFYQIRGKNHPNWKGGTTSIDERVRKSLEYKLWRIAVFERDNYTCIWCGQKGGKLNADHIKPFALFPELRFAIDNGRTLCVKCHKTTDTWGARTK